MSVNTPIISMMTNTAAVRKWGYSCQFWLCVSVQCTLISRQCFDTPVPWVGCRSRTPQSGTAAWTTAHWFQPTHNKQKGLLQYNYYTCEAKKKKKMTVWWIQQPPSTIPISGKKKLTHLFLKELVFKSLLSGVSSSTSKDGSILLEEELEDLWFSHGIQASVLATHTYI